VLKMEPGRNADATKSGYAEGQFVPNIAHGAFICGNTPADDPMPKQRASKSSLAGITRESIENKASGSSAVRATAQILEFSPTVAGCRREGWSRAMSQRFPFNAKTSLAGITRESIENKASVKQVVTKLRRQTSDLQVKADRPARKRQRIAAQLRSGSEQEVSTAILPPPTNVSRREITARAGAQSV
jgi:hypothetical protein